ncbi:MAG TPA: DinB family protein [Desulfomonilaceae bacterium]|nr:DinB family protein [Desulfomonilaceae bacterium]
MKPDEVTRRELLALLEGGNAHMSFDEVVADFPAEHVNSKPPETPYSFWHIVEHIRITQWDILEFIRNPSHVSPHYPEGYRPRPEQLTDAKGWNRSIEGVLADLKALKAIVRDKKTDLCAPIPHAPEYTIFREIVLAADHNAYHIGELAIMRQVTDLWPEGRKYLTGKPD